MTLEDSRTIILRVLRKFFLRDIFWSLDYLLFQCVASFVVSHVSLRPEGHVTALGAGERPLVIVNPHVDDHVLLLAEPLQTLWKSASVWLGTKVNVHVGCQTYFPHESLRTAFVRALYDLADLFVLGVLSFGAALALICTLATPFRQVLFSSNVACERWPV